MRTQRTQAQQDAAVKWVAARKRNKALRAAGLPVPPRVVVVKQPKPPKTAQEQYEIGWERGALLAREAFARGERDVPITHYMRGWRDGVREIMDALNRGETA